MAAPTIMWFRRDLRLADNVALCAAAAEGGPVVPLYVIDPVFAKTGAARQNFLAANLRALGASLGDRLVIRYGDPVTEVVRLAAEVGARTVHATTDYGPYGSRRDRDVAAALTTTGRHLSFVGSPYAVTPGSVMKGDGSPYAVFTPFSRAWQAVGWDEPIDAADVNWLGGTDVPSAGYPAVPPCDAQLPAAGEHAAHDRLDAFLAGPLATYDTDRDRPGVDGTSGLSAYLRFGVLHPRQILIHLGGEHAHERFRAELAWRDFYADVLYHQPRTAWENLRRDMDRLPVDTDAEARARFETWTRGGTGYPIVDAGMRQLLAIGWMHNRVRMIVASFLVKDLHLPWQWGARHFMRHLVDGDLASNNHGWQWAAGTGTDAAPYFRVFNPTSQSERYDPDGTYIRRWVPELANVAGSDVHAPWMSRRGQPLGYPPPIVDHAAERAEALRRLSLLRRHD